MSIFPKRYHVFISNIGHLFVSYLMAIHFILVHRQCINLLINSFSPDALSWWPIRYLFDVFRSKCLSFVIRRGLPFCPLFLHIACMHCMPLEASTYTKNLKPKMPLDRCHNFFSTKLSNNLLFFSPVYTPEQLAEKYSNITFLLYCIFLVLIVALHHAIYRWGSTNSLPFWF